MIVSDVKFGHKRKHKKRSQFHKLSHESFCCMHFEMFQVRTFHIEILYMSIYHRIFVAEVTKIVSILQFKFYIKFKNSLMWGVCVL